MGTLEATYYRWKQLYGGPGPSELRKRCQIEEENQKLKRLAADLPLDKTMLQVVDVMDRLLFERGASPSKIRVDNGPEFISQALPRRK